MSKWKVCFGNKVLCEFDTIQAAKYYQNNEARNLLTYIVVTIENKKDKTKTLKES